MKAVILNFIPLLSEELEAKAQYQLAYVQMGLSEPRIVGVEKGKFSIGDEVDLSAEALERDADGLLISMAEELYKNGRSECVIVEDEDFGERSEPLNYEVYRDCPKDRSEYLSHIWKVMKEIGRFDVKENFQYYCLNYPENVFEIHRVFELGYLVSEYRWRLAHERAAQESYEASRYRLVGLAAASQARTEQGRRTSNLLFNLARLAIEREPKRRWTRKSLAEHVLEMARIEAEANFEDPELEISSTRARKLIGEFVASGKLSFPQENHRKKNA